MSGQRVGEPIRMSWGRALGIASVATAAATLLMFWMRSAFQIRALPERVMEWSLLFVAPAQFEAAIGQLGDQAKVLALYASVAGMALILVVLGALLLRRARSAWFIAAAGPLLYLVAMAGVVPLTDGGVFGAALPQDPWLVNACYLAICLTYACALLGGSYLAIGSATGPAGEPRAAAGASVGAAGESTGEASALDEPSAPGEAPAPGGLFARRRALLVALPATAAAYLFVAWRGQGGAGRGGDLPLARVNATPGLTPPAAGATWAGVTPPPASLAAATRAVTTQPVATPSSASANVASATPSPVAPAVAAAPTAPQSAASPTRAPLAVSPTPEPALPTGSFSKQLARGEDGALSGAGREPGTLAALITPTDRFYYVTKNAVSDPVIQPMDWRLAIDGDVRSPVQLDYRTLRQLPSVEVTKTLECVSNFTAECQLVPFGCDLISTAVWRGVLLKDVLDLAGGPAPGVVSVTLVAADEFTSAIPLDVALDPSTVLAYEMNGQPLPYEHGYPARVLSSGRYGYKSAKWITGIRATTGNPLDWYGRRNWNKDGIVKTMTRIDVPAPGATLAPGPQRAAGIAYAGDRGIAGVEVSGDGGITWQAARLLEPAPGKDAWVRWEVSVDLPAGATVRLVGRATDGTGTLQTSDFTLPAPDGASGWNSIQVSAA